MKRARRNVRETLRERAEVGEPTSECVRGSGRVTEGMSDLIASSSL